MEYGESEMNLLEEFKKNIWNKDSKLDNWLNKKFNAYGWSGFVARAIGFFLPVFMGALYFIYDDTNIYSYSRGLILGALSVVLLLKSLYILSSQYSKKGREAHQEKLRKDALMEVEIKERQKNNEKKLSPPSAN